MNLLHFMETTTYQGEEIAGYPVEDWQRDVLNDVTWLGYFDWVKRQQTGHEGDEASPEGCVPFTVEVAELTATRVDRSSEQVARDAKAAFVKGLAEFYEVPQDLRQLTGTELDYKVVVTVTDDEGNEYVFNQDDDDGLPFIPESHLQNP